MGVEYTFTVINRSDGLKLKGTQNFDELHNYPAVFWCGRGFPLAVEICNYVNEEYISEIDEVILYRVIAALQKRLEKEKAIANYYAAGHGDVDDYAEQLELIDSIEESILMARSWLLLWSDTMLLFDVSY